MASHLGRVVGQLQEAAAADFGVLAQNQGIPFESIEGEWAVVGEGCETCDKE